MTFVNLTSINKFFIWLFQGITLILLLMFVNYETPLTFNTNLTSLFSFSNEKKHEQIQNEIDAKLNTNLIYLVGHKNLDSAIKSTNLLVDELKQVSSIINVSAKLKNIPNQKSLIDSYLGFEQQIMTPEYRSYLLTENKKVFDLQFKLLNQLGDQLVPNTINKDQTLAFAQFLNRSPFPSNNLTLTHDGYLTLTYENLHYILVTMQTDKDAFNLNTAKEIVTQLNNISTEESVEYIRTGAIFYSYEASEQAQKEMKVLGGLSILATLLLIFFAYRRFITIVCTVFLIFVSIAYGFLGLSLFFDEVNILSIVFAITLIGIAADYSFHSLTELQNISKINLNPLKKITPSLILSFATTALGYLLLMLVPIAVFKQIAIFTIFGLFGALLTVLLLFPYLHKRLKFKNSIHPVFINFNKKHKRMCEGWFDYLSLVIVLSIISIVILTQINFSDDAKSFYQVPEQLFENENKVKNMLGQKLDNQYLLLQSDTPQKLLELEEEAIALLDELQLNGSFSSYQAVASWLPSIKQQQSDNQLLLDASKQGQFDTLKEAIGAQRIQIQKAEKFLMPKEWFTSPIGKIFKHLWLQDNENYYSMIKFAGIKNSHNLSLELNVLNNSTFVDKLADTESELAIFRLVLGFIFIIACLTGLVVFYFRYGINQACIGVIAPASAFIIALGISALIQGNLTLFNLAAGLVILALGLDYSIFYAEHGFSALITKTTLLSALSSIFVFAILSFSSTPAIASFGQTVFLGIVITFLFSPIITKISGKRDLYAGH